MWQQPFFLVVFALLWQSATSETGRMTSYQQRRQLSPALTKLDFTLNAVYNKLYERPLNLNASELSQIEPRSKVWFAIANGSLFALPMFGDYPGPFRIQLLSSKLLELHLQFHFKPSTSLFSPSNHLLLAVFNLSAAHFHRSSLNRYHLVRSISLALNLSEHFLTVHKINGTMIKVYFSCDLYTSPNLTEQIQQFIAYYYVHRLELVQQFPLPLIEISIVRLAKSIGSSSPPTSIELKKAAMNIRSRLSKNLTIAPSSMSAPTIHLEQFYQPLVLVPLGIILIGLLICTIIAICLCCNRQSSSTSTLLLPTNAQGTPTNRHLYQNYNYHKQRQQQEYYKRKHYLQDQRQFISKGIPVVFTEELEEKLEQTHTPLVMRIEKAPYC